DPSNAAVEYLRNKIRLELLPRLEAEYNPNVRAALNRTAALARDDDDVLKYLAHRAFRRMARTAPDLAARTVTLPARELRRRATALRRRILRHAVSRAGGALDLLTYDHVEGILALLDGEPGAAVDLPGGVRARREREALVFEPRTAGAGAAGHADTAGTGDTADTAGGGFAVELTAPGRTVIWGNKVIDAAFIEPPPAGARPGPDEAWLDRGRLSPPLTARTWRPGERIDRE